MDRGSRNPSMPATTQRLRESDLLTCLPAARVWALSATMGAAARSFLILFFFFLSTLRRKNPGAASARPTISAVSNASVGAVHANEIIF